MPNVVWLERIEEDLLGEKGARQTPAGAGVAELLTDELVSLGDVTSKKMFGGHGVFEDGVMFALIDSAGTAYLRADDTTSQTFAAAGSEPHGKMPYWSIPGHVMADSAALVEWARQARDVAKSAKKK